MEIKGALIKIKDSTFAIIEVNESIISDDVKALDFIKKHAFFFPRVPIVLMSIKADNKPVYYGRKEELELLVNISPKQIPWKRYIVKKGR